jgi:hypothetical protein
VSNKSDHPTVDRCECGAGLIWESRESPAGIRWLALCCILAVAWLLAQVYAPHETARRVMELAGAARTWIGRSRLHAAALPATVVVLVLVAVAGYSIRRRSARWQASAPPVQIADGVPALTASGHGTMVRR